KRSTPKISLIARRIRHPHFPSRRTATGRTVQERLFPSCSRLIDLDLAEENVCPCGRRCPPNAYVTSRTAEVIKTEPLRSRSFGLRLRHDQLERISPDIAVKGEA